MVISLPEPYDVQVATAWPAVDAYRRAYSRALVLREWLDLNGPTLMNHIDLYQDDSSEAGLRIRERARRDYMERAVPLLALERALPGLERSAEAVARGAAGRARMSVHVWRAASREERVAEEARRRLRRR